MIAHKFSATREQIMTALYSAGIADLSTPGESNGSPGTGGAYVIDVHAEMTQAEIESSMHSQVLSRLYKPNGVILEDDNGDGVFEFPDLGTVISGSVEVFSYPYTKNDYNSNTNTLGCSSSYRCTNLTTDSLSEITSFTVDASAGTLTVPTQAGNKIVVNYKNDPSTIKDGWLQMLLIQGTACKLGKALFSTDTDWKYIEDHCTNFQRGLDMLKEGYVTPDLLAYDWLQPFSTRKNSITSVRIGRA